MEYVAVGVLSLVILLAVFMAVRGLWGGGLESGPSELTFKCEKCNKEFPKKTSDLVAMQSADPIGDERNLIKIDCPLCGAKKSSWQERECPSCHKLFIPQSEEARYRALTRGMRGAPDVPDVCTFCKTDLNKWYREHAPKP